MKQIGYTNFTKDTWWTGDMAFDIQRFPIYTREDNENVIADHYWHFGYVLLADNPASHVGAVVYRDKMDAGRNGVAIYLKVDKPTALQYVAPAEFEALAARVKQLEQRATDPAPSPMSFYDYAFIHAAINHPGNHDPHIPTDRIIRDAHTAAERLTINRHPVSPAIVRK